MRAGDIEAVRAMLVVRPELVHLDVAEPLAWGETMNRGAVRAILRKQAQGQPL